MQTLYSKLLIITFPSYFLVVTTDCQHSNIISYELLTNNILISFGHPLRNLKHITPLFIPPRSIYKSFPFCFILDLINSPQAFCFDSRYFSLLVFLFPLLPQFTFLTNTITNIIILPSSFSMPSWTFCPSPIPTCSI